MINILHLLWIAPLCFGFGFMLAAVLSMAKEGETNESDTCNGSTVR